MWCDDWDGDLFKILPEVKAVMDEPVDYPAHDELQLPPGMGRIGDEKLWVFGHETGGKLNGPALWNGYEAMIGFAGLTRQSCKPADGFVAGEHHGPVEATWEEVCRDIWAHGCQLLIGGKPIINTFGMQNATLDLLLAVRRKQERDPAKVRQCLLEYQYGTENFRRIMRWAEEKQTSRSAEFRAMNRYGDQSKW